MASSYWQEYTWPDGDIEGWLWTGGLFISKDYNPETGVAYAFYAPPGGRSNVPVIAQGAPGQPFTPGDVTVTTLDWDDATPDSAVWTLVTPGDDDTPAVYDFALSIHGGDPGDDGSVTLLTADDVVGTPLAGYELIYSATAGSGSTPAAVWTAPKNGNVYWPATIASTTSADGAQRTLCSVSIPSYPFDYRLEAFGGCIITGTGEDVRVDVMARLNNATSGDIIARGYGIAGAAPPRNDLLQGPDAGSATTVGKVTASNACTVYFRAERQSGSDSFSTTAATTRFYVKVVPLP